MKKSLLIVFTLVVSLFLLTTVAGAEGELIEKSSDKMIGFDMPSYGWAQHNEQGQITGYKGFNFGLGYSEKIYFEPGLKEGEWNNYWGWGTVLVLVPYGEVGTEYVFAKQDNGAFWTAGGSLQMITILPSASLKASYHF